MKHYVEISSFSMASLLIRGNMHSIPMLIDKKSKKKIDVALNVAHRFPSSRSYLPSDNIFIPFRYGEFELITGSPTYARIFFNRVDDGMTFNIVDRYWSTRFYGTEKDIADIIGLGRFIFQFKGL